MEKNTTQQTTSAYPKTGSILALVGGVLDAHGGTYLQKFITKEAGLSRLKTHRVVASLSERGIVHVEVRGNTNEVSLVKWFHDGMHQ
jgi:hypothetical protein